jgi:hypothetical protein
MDNVDSVCPVFGLLLEIGEILPVPDAKFELQVVALVPVIVVHFRVLCVFEVPDKSQMGKWVL